jgi:ribonuclease HI
MKNSKRKDQGNDRSQIPVRIYCDGAGSRPDGKGSGYAWLQEDSESRYVHRQDGLTNNEAEYLALHAALDALPAHSCAEVMTDSLLICTQFEGRCRVFDPKLARRLAEVQELIAKKQLTIKLTWIPRQQNLAHNLL